MTVAVTIPDEKSQDWFERLCAKRGWVIVDGMAWAKHADEHARWFGGGVVNRQPAPRRHAMTQSQRECLEGA